MVSRLTTDLLKVVKSDASNDRGLRTIENGDLNLLRGFEFNANGKLGATLFSPFKNAFDRVSGDANVNISPFSPKIRIAAPKGTTHFKIVMGAAALDFETEASVFESDETAILPYDAADTSVIDLNVSLTPNTKDPVIQVLGIEFYQEVNGQMYPLKNGAYNALSIIDSTTM